MGVLKETSVGSSADDGSDAVGLDATEILIST